MNSSTLQLEGAITYFKGCYIDVIIGSVLNKLSRHIAFVTRLHLLEDCMCSKQRYRSACASRRSESSLSAWRCLATHRASPRPCTKTDQTVRIRSLTWVLAGRTCTCNLVGKAVPDSIMVMYTLTRISVTSEPGLHCYSLLLFTDWHNIGWKWHLFRDLVDEIKKHNTTEIR